MPTTGLVRAVVGLEAETTMAGDLRMGANLWENGWSWGWGQGRIRGDSGGGVLKNEFNSAIAELNFPVTLPLRKCCSAGVGVAVKASPWVDALKVASDFSWLLKSFIS